MQLFRDFFNAIWTFFTVDLWTWAGEFLTYCWQTIKIYAIDFATLLVGLLSSAIATLDTYTGDLFAIFGGYWEQIPPDMLAIMTLLNIHLALLMLFGAFVTRFSVRLLVKVLT